MSGVIHTEFIQLRDIADDSKKPGLTVELLPDGGSYPTNAITLTQDSGVNWRYNFPAGVTNGEYTLYVGGVVVNHGGGAEKIRVIRDGLIEPSDTTFVD